MRYIDIMSISESSLMRMMNRVLCCKKSKCLVLFQFHKPVEFQESE